MYASGSIEPRFGIRDGSFSTVWERAVRVIGGLGLEVREMTQFGVSGGGRRGGRAVKLRDLETGGRGWVVLLHAGMILPAAGSVYSF